MIPKRKNSWLALEWFGTIALGALPDHAWLNSLYARIAYYSYNQKRWPNLKTPRTFNEKMIVQKLSKEAGAPIRRTITDKHLVKDHITALVGHGHVVPTLAILRTREEIDRFQFPTSCVVKPTHSCQEVLFVDGAQPTAEERQRLKYWLWKDYYPANREPNYRGLEHKIIVEPVIGGRIGAIEDIKVMCFHGRPKFIQVDHDRFGAHGRDFFDIRGERLEMEMRFGPAGRPFPYPDKIARLLEIARTLSAGFPFLRVDFYVSGVDVFVGELTSFPSNCTKSFRPAPADLLLAQLFDDPDFDLTPAAIASAVANDPPRATRRPDPEQGAALSAAS